MGLLQGRRTGLDRQAAGHFRHRGEQRQATALVGYGFIGNGRDARVDQALGLLRIWRQVQIGVEDLAFAQLHPFGRLRFFHLNDHVGLFEHVFGRGCNLRASGDIGVVVGADTGPCTRFNQDIMAMRHIFADGTGGETDTVFMVFDFLRATDTH